MKSSVKSLGISVGRFSTNIFAMLFAIVFGVVSGAERALADDSTTGPVIYGFRTFQEGFPLETAKEIYKEEQNLREYKRQLAWVEYQLDTTDWTTLRNPGQTRRILRSERDSLKTVIFNGEYRRDLLLERGNQVATKLKAEKEKSEKVHASKDKKSRKAIGKLAARGGRLAGGALAATAIVATGTENAEASEIRAVRSSGDVPQPLKLNQLNVGLDGLESEANEAKDDVATFSQPQSRGSPTVR